MTILCAGLGAFSGVGANNVKAMNKSILDEKSWGAKAFNNYG